MSFLELYYIIQEPILIYQIIEGGRRYINLRSRYTSRDFLCVYPVALYFKHNR